MKVLVTGAAGFLGRYVCRALVSAGHDVVGYDLEAQNDRLPPIGPEAEWARVGLTAGSVLDLDSLEWVMRDREAVIHLAAMVGVARTESKRAECLEVNVEGTMNVCRAARQAGLKRLVFASSSEVYGRPPAAVRFFNEDLAPAPVSVYGVSKLAGEEIGKACGVRSVILRPFNLYGTGQGAEFVIPRFIAGCLDGSGPQVNGSGQQVRAFCHARDAAEAFERALRCDLADGRVVNIGREEPASMLALAERISRIVARVAGQRYPTPVRCVGWSSRDADRPLAREIAYRVPLCERAVYDLGWVAETSLEEGLLETVRGMMNEE